MERTFKLKMAGRRKASPQLMGLIQEAIATLRKAAEMAVDDDPWIQSNLEDALQSCRDAKEAAGD